MLKKGTLAFLALTLCTMATLGVSVATVEPPARPVNLEQVGQSLGFIERLLSVSSVAQNIEETKFPPAMAYLQEARRLHRLAREDLDKGKLEAAITKRDEAIRLALEAGHLAQMASGDHDKQQADFQSKARSIRALMQAYHNVAKKKGLQQQAASLQEKTEGLLAQATGYRDSEDFASASHTLNQAYSQLKTALEKVRGGETLGELSRASANFDGRYSDYDAKMRSLRALLDAHQRIASEKPEATEAKKLIGTIEQLIQQAEGHASHGDYDQAQAAVDYAYAQVTASIEQLRGGETLVRTLTFETKEEEYHYELDRNDTYRMLITMLIEEKQTMEVTPRIRLFMDKAQTLRKEAEEHADHGEFEEAIALLEKATRNLIFAMRNAGFFVPG